jgi:molecular chaperone DnaJ
MALAAMAHEIGASRMKKDYYLVLQLKPGATAEEVRSAYRHRALEVHPDHSGAGSAPFLELQEAYAVLSDPQRRAVYDRAAEEVPIRRANTAWRAEPVRVPRTDAEPLRAAHPTSPADAASFSGRSSFSSEEVFGGLWSDATFSRPPGAVGAQKSILQVPLSPEQAYQGGEVRILIPVRVTCRACRGWGNAGPYECRSCEGAGTLTGAYPVMVSYPGRLQGDYRVHLSVHLSLECFGSQGFTVCFRPSRARCADACVVWR